jgi:phosphate transport system substrate-binding protein
VIGYASVPVPLADSKMLQAYIGYLLGPGQQVLTQLGYAPLPSKIATQAKDQLNKITK